MKTRKCVVLFLVELVILGALGLSLRNQGQQVPFSVSQQQEQREDGTMGTYFISEKLTLQPGVYQLLLNYQTDVDMAHVVDVLSDAAPYQSIRTNTTVLYAGQNHTDYEFWVDKPVSDLQVRVTHGGQGSLQVKEGMLVRTNLRERQRFLLGVGFFCMLNVLILWIPRQDACTKKRAVLLFFMIAGCSAPLLTDYILPGADMTFHLLRVEGIKDALLSGQFPVRMHPNWLQGHGYGAGIFYCDFFLYVPAILRIFGFTVQGAYKAYKLFVNIGTCLIAYESFRRILKNESLALLGSFLYTFQVIRLIYIYGVDGVGQFTAMMFFPLVAYGFYRIFTMDTGEKRYAYSFIPLTIGLSGIILSHVLSGLMTAFFALLLCLICIKRVWKPKVFRELCKTVIACLLLNAWYLVPFLDYTVSMDFAVTKGAATAKQIQTWGMYIPQLFEPFPWGGQYNARSGLNGMVSETAYGIGLGLDIVFVITAFALLVWGRRIAKDSKILLFFSGISLFAATLYFPWHNLAKTFVMAKQLIATLQFPYRMLVPGSVFLTLYAVFLLRDLGRSYNTEKRTEDLLGGKVNSGILANVSAVFMILGTLFSTVFYMNTSLSQSDDFFRIYDETCMGNSYISGAEYVLLDTDVQQLTYKDPVCGEGVQIISYDKKGCRVVMDVATEAFGGQNQKDEQLAYVELPLLYYKGYKAVDPEGQQLTVVCGNNNVLRVLLPWGYQGQLVVDFYDLWYWRIAEFVSLGTLLMILALARKSGRGILAEGIAYPSKSRKTR